MPTLGSAFRIIKGVKPDKYHIHMVSSMFDGKSFSIAGFGIGSISSHNAEIEVCIPVKI